MKNIIKFLYILIILSQHIYSQGSILNTTSDFNDKVISDDNTTLINLFNIDYNGNKIPLNIIYSHSGVRIKEDYGELGCGWKLENLGFIENIVNGNLDYETEKGWFYDPASTFYFNNETLDANCTSFWTYPEENSGSQHIFFCTPNNFEDGDLSPDFYSVSTATGVKFDFLIENIQSYPSVISNSQNSQVLVFPENFQTNMNSTNSGVVFNIIDDKGNKYNFISGPKIIETNRLSEDTSFRNNFYLQSLTNPESHNDFLEIEYFDVEYTSNFDNFYTGTNIYDSFNPNSQESQDYNNNIINNLFTVDSYSMKMKKVMTKITTKNNIIEFEYNIDRLLEKIHINNSSGENLFSYEFNYNTLGNNYFFQLQSINKVNYSQNFSQKIYEFEYFNNINPIALTDVNERLDYFGYFNNSNATTNKFPFQVRKQDNTVLSADNLNPDLFYAKQLSLKKIINKFGGTIDFDYSLNAGICQGENVSMFYGGGLVLESKTYSPTIGKQKKIKYEYEDLNGFVINLSNPKINYLKQTNNKKYWTSRLELVNTETLVTHDSTYINHTAIRGNFFKKVRIKEYDFNTMLLESQKIIRNIPKYEGINFSPKIKNETLFDSNYNIVKEIEYSYNHIENFLFPSARVIVISNITSPSSGIFYAEKKVLPIYGNKGYLKNVLIKSSSNNNDMIENINYYYTNSGDSLDMLTSNNSQGESRKVVYSYPHSNNNSTQNEPFRNELIAKNIVGMPLKTETYIGTEKRSEQKTVFAKDASTNNLLLPKFVYAKKGTDVNATLEKKLTYDLYDDKGNALQYTRENGVSNVTIWGYNKTQPLAQIENIQYSNISSYVPNLQTLSNSDNDTCTSGTCNEQLLRNALNSLRTTLASSYPNARMTSYTYNPLVGVTSVTDVKSDVQYYIYDSFQRLIKVIDKDGKIVSEKEYNYKPQN